MCLPFIHHSGHLPVNAQFVSLEREYQWCGRGICVDGQALVAPSHESHSTWDGSIVAY
jgi:hypothetical protein